MLDFFMADQLCSQVLTLNHKFMNPNGAKNLNLIFENGLTLFSQVPMLRNLEYIACYYITGSYATQDYGYCMRVKYYRDLAYAVSFLPYYCRAMQVKKLN